MSFNPLNNNNPPHPVQPRNRDDRAAAGLNLCFRINAAGMDKDLLQLATPSLASLPKTNLVPKPFKQQKKESCMPAFPLHGNLSKAITIPLMACPLDEPYRGVGGFCSCLVAVQV